MPHDYPATEKILEAVRKRLINAAALCEQARSAAVDTLGAAERLAASELALVATFLVAEEVLGTQDCLNAVGKVAAIARLKDGVGNEEVPHRRAVIAV